MLKTPTLGGPELAGAILGTDRQGAGASATIRIVLAEDSYLVREGIQRIIATAPDLELVGVCSDLESLRAMIAELRPDVVLTDIRMPPYKTDEGVRLATELRGSHAEMGLVILSQHASAVYASALLAAGAAGRAYVLKDRVADAEMLIGIVREIAAGGSHLDPEVFQAVVSDWERDANDRLKTLSPRELKVLELIANGSSNTVIAGKLSISARGVERHINAIFKKLDVGSSDGVSRRVVATLAYLDGRERH